jgi:hypothetical protein
MGEGMQIVVNGAYVRNKVKIGNYVQWTSMALLVIGFLLSLPYGAQYLGQETSLFAAYAALIAALLLLNFGRTFTRRWGPRFRQDQWLIPNLKGLDNKSTLFNYPSSNLPDHILVSPGGLYILLPKANGGKIRYDGSRFTRGSATGTILRGLSEGGLGNPIEDARRAISLLATYLKTYGSEELVSGLEARPVVVFTNPGVQLDVRNAQFPVLAGRELKSIFRRTKPVLSDEKVEELKQVIGREVVQ